MSYFADKELCTGCSACANACPVKCIEMKADKYGFHFPDISDASACISCGICKEVCSIQNVMEKRSSEPIAYAAYTNDDELRMDSSSGGIFSEVASQVLKMGGVVFGAAYSDTFEIKHICVDKAEALHKLRGAKYAESELGSVFCEVKNMLEKGNYVLFAGTPCQVGGLKCFLKQDYEKLLLIDFACHGVPSPMVWREFIKYRAKTDADGQMPKEINLREKKSGWSRYLYSNYFGYPGGEEYCEISTKSKYMNLFTEDYITRESCGNCKFKGYSRSSDITLGDFWGIWDIAPEMDDNRGTSAVLIQSDKGQRFWSQIKGRVRYKRVELEEVSKQNSSLITTSKPKEDRIAVLEVIRTEGFGAKLPIRRKKVSFWKKIKKKLLDSL